MLLLKKKTQQTKNKKHPHRHGVCERGAELEVTRSILCCLSCAVEYYTLSVEDVRQRLVTSFENLKNPI